MKLKWNHKNKMIVCCLFLVLTTGAAYWQVKDHDFVNFDDGIHVTDNPTIKKGLTLEGITCAFTSCAQTEGILLWHPVTWLSFMLDYQLYGLNPKGYHITNVIFHIVNVLLLFFILNRMTHAVWRPAFVAALFALHPLHVESVAWVSERKDVLSAFFGFLTIAAYIHYVDKPGIRRYLPILILFSLSLMAKSMLVTLPFVLLLLDYWPLGRLRSSAVGGAPLHPPINSGAKEKLKREEPARLLEEKTNTGNVLSWPQIRFLFLEKIPLFMLSIIFSIITYTLHQQQDAIDKYLNVSDRIINALHAYFLYMSKMIWPQDLAAFYPYGGMPPIWQIAFALLLLLSMTMGSFYLVRRVPYLTVGWFWYLGTLIPVIGILQVGEQAIADRYTYIPLIGLFIVVSWGMPDLVKRLPYKQVFLGTSAGFAILAMMMITWVQVGYWNNSIALFEHAVLATKNNYLAHNNIGAALTGQGKIDEGIIHYREALRIIPFNATSHNALGYALLMKGEMKEAEAHFLEALSNRPDYTGAYYNLGHLYMKSGNTDKAIAHYRRAIEKDPNHEKAHYGLGVALFSQRRYDEALLHMGKVLQRNPLKVGANGMMGNILVQKRKTNEAIEYFKEEIRISPKDASAYNDLGGVYYLQGRQGEAIACYNKALTLDSGNDMAKNNLQVALKKQNVTESMDTCP